MSITIFLDNATLSITKNNPQTNNVFYLREYVFPLTHHWIFFWVL